MTDVDNLAAALVAFQAEVPVIPKNRVAKMVSYSYKYADLSDIWDAIRQPLAKNGLAVTQPLTTAESTGCIGIKTIVWHESGQKDESVVEFPVAGRNPQEVGSAITYYKRYALSAALGISTDDDDDGAAATHAPNQQQRNQPNPAVKAAPKSKADQKRDQLRALAASKGWPLDKVAAKFTETVQTDDGKPADLKTAGVEAVEAFILSLETGVVTI